MENISPLMVQEYTFRHRSSCRTPAESRRETLTTGKEYIDPCKICKTNEGGEKPESEQDWFYTWWVGVLELQLFGTEEKNLRLLESAAVICNRLKGMQTIQTILATAIHTLSRDASPLKCVSARS